jgi:hypothetical protein
MKPQQLNTVRAVFVTAKLCVEKSGAKERSRMQMFLGFDDVVAMAEMVALHKRSVSTWRILADSETGSSQGRSYETCRASGTAASMSRCVRLLFCSLTVRFGLVLCAQRLQLLVSGLSREAAA